MTIPGLVAPRVAGRKKSRQKDFSHAPHAEKTRRKGLTYAPAIRTIPTSLFKFLQLPFVPLLSNDQSQKKERKA